MPVGGTIGSQPSAARNVIPPTDPYWSPAPGGAHDAPVWVDVSPALGIAGVGRENLGRRGPITRLGRETRVASA